MQHWDPDDHNASSEDYEDLTDFDEESEESEGVEFEHDDEDSSEFSQDEYGMPTLSPERACGGLCRLLQCLGDRFRALKAKDNNRENCCRRLLDDVKKLPGAVQAFFLSKGVPLERDSRKIFQLIGKVAGYYIDFFLDLITVITFLANREWGFAFLCVFGVVMSEIANSQEEGYGKGAKTGAAKPDAKPEAAKEAEEAKYREYSLPRCAMESLILFFELRRNRERIMEDIRKEDIRKARAEKESQDARQRGREGREGHGRSRGRGGPGRTEDTSAPQELPHGLFRWSKKDIDKSMARWVHLRRLEERIYPTLKNEGFIEAPINTGVQLYVMIHRFKEFRVWTLPSIFCGIASMMLSGAALDFEGKKVSNALVVKDRKEKTVHYVVGAGVKDLEEIFVHVFRLFEVLSRLFLLAMLQQTCRCHFTGLWAHATAFVWVAVFDVLLAAISVASSPSDFFYTTLQATLVYPSPVLLGVRPKLAPVSPLYFYLVRSVEAGIMLKVIWTWREDTLADQANLVLFIWITFFTAGVFHLGLLPAIFLVRNWNCENLELMRENLASELLSVELDDSGKGEPDQTKYLIRWPDFSLSKGSVWCENKDATNTLLKLRVGRRFKSGVRRYTAQPVEETSEFFKEVDFRPLDNKTTGDGGFHQDDDFSQVLSVRFVSRHGHRRHLDDVCTIADKMHYSMQKLQKLNVSHWRLDAKSWELLLRHCPPLQDLDLSFCRMDRQSCSVIGIRLAEKMRDTLVTLNLSNNATLGGRHHVSLAFLIEPLACGLERKDKSRGDGWRGKLESLLACGGRKKARAWSPPPALETLNLGHCDLQFSEDEVKMLGFGNLKLKTLIMENSPGLKLKPWKKILLDKTDGLKDAPLEKLDCSNCGWHDKMCQELARQRAWVKTLRCLDLGGNSEITERGWKSILATYASPHEAFSLTALRGLTKVLEERTSNSGVCPTEATKIRELDFEDVSVALFTVVLRSCEAIERLSMGQMESAAFYKFFEEVFADKDKERLKKLESLKCDHCEHIVSEAWNGLLCKLASTEIKSLSLVGSITMLNREGIECGLSGETLGSPEPKRKPLGLGDKMTKKGEQKDEGKGKVFTELVFLDLSKNAELTQRHSSGATQVEAPEAASRNEHPERIANHWTKLLESTGKLANLQKLVLADINLGVIINGLMPGDGHGLADVPLGADAELRAGARGLPDHPSLRDLLNGTALKQLTHLDISRNALREEHWNKLLDALQTRKEKRQEDATCEVKALEELAIYECGLDKELFRVQDNVVTKLLKLELQKVYLDEPSYAELRDGNLPALDGNHSWNVELHQPTDWDLMALASDDGADCSDDDEKTRRKKRSIRQTSEGWTRNDYLLDRAEQFRDWFWNVSD